MKAASESHADVGDRANDALRVNGDELRCKVVGEGGNLGFTQRGRIECARWAAAINTDAIDNSAGVDTSDHEVNIKILLGERARAPASSPAKQRNTLLAAMTDEVGQPGAARQLPPDPGDLVARPHGAPERIDEQARFMRDLEKHGRLDRAVEFLPDDEAIAERAAVKRA